MWPVSVTSDGEIFSCVPVYVCVCVCLYVLCKFSCNHHRHVFVQNIVNKNQTQINIHMMQQMTSAPKNLCNSFFIWRGEKRNRKRGRGGGMQECVEHDFYKTL